MGRFSINTQNQANPMSKIPHDRFYVLLHSINKHKDKSRVGPVPRSVAWKECFVGEGLDAGQLSGSCANVAMFTSEWPFLPNCPIVLVGQAGGSKASFGIW